MRSLLISKFLKSSRLRPRATGLEITKGHVSIVVEFPLVDFVPGDTFQTTEWLRSQIQREGFSDSSGNAADDILPLSSNEEERCSRWLIRWIRKAESLQASTSTWKFRYAGLRLQWSEPCIIHGVYVDPSQGSSIWHDSEDSLLLRGNDINGSIDQTSIIQPSNDFFGHIDGFSENGEIFGWIASKSSVLNEINIILICGDFYYSCKASSDRPDAMLSNTATVKGFHVGGAKLLPLLKEFNQGKPIFLLDQDGKNATFPLLWSSIAKEKRYSSLCSWLSLRSIEDISNDNSPNNWINSELKKQVNSTEQESVLKSFSRLQDIYGEESYSAVLRKENAYELVRLFKSLSEENPTWRDAQTVFTLIWLQEMLRSYLLGLVLTDLNTEKNDQSQLDNAFNMLSYGWLPATSNIIRESADKFLRNAIEGLMNLAIELYHEGLSLTDASNKLLLQVCIQADLQFGIRIDLIDSLQQLYNSIINTQRISYDKSRSLIQLFNSGKDIKLISHSKYLTSTELEKQYSTVLSSILRLSRAFGLDPDFICNLLRSDLNSLDQNKNPVLLNELQILIRVFSRDLLCHPVGNQTWQEHWKYVRQLRQLRAEQCTQIMTLMPDVNEKEKINSKKVYNILVIGNKDLPQVYRYRQEKIVLDLKSLQLNLHLDVESIDSWEQINDSKLTQRLLYTDLLVLCRLPATENTLPLALTAKRLGIPIVFDIDDPVHDIKIFPPPYETYYNSIDLNTYYSLAADTASFLSLLSLADVVTTTTSKMKESIARCTQLPDWRILIHPNLILPELSFQSQLPSDSRNIGMINIIYGTGTKAHKMYFYQIVLPVLIQIADDNPNVRIILIGEVDQRSARSSHENIKWIQPKNYSEYLNILHNAHISIAPLEINGATDCKSELKWLEGTMLEIAMVVSPTHAYREVLSDEEDVLFASNSNQWYDQLNRLVRDSVLRKKLVYNSKLKADLLFNQSINISSWNNILRELCVIGSSSD